MFDLRHLVIAIVLMVLTIVASATIAAVTLVRLPADYLCRDLDEPRIGERGSALKRLARNVTGALLVAGGLILAIPGIPGQGALLAIAGLLLMDFPGQRKVLRILAARPSLWGAINGLRRAFSRPPLEIGGGSERIAPQDRGSDG
jgi:hypothetical protein